jgi:hypothetical protein
VIDPLSLNGGYTARPRNNQVDWLGRSRADVHARKDEVDEAAAAWVDASIEVFGHKLAPLAPGSPPVLRRREDDAAPVLKWASLSQLPADRIADPCCQARISSFLFEQHRHDFNAYDFVDDEPLAIAA